MMPKMTEIVANREDHLGGKGTLDLTKMNGVRIPTDYDITNVFGDIIMLKIIDQNEHGEVLRDGIWINQNTVTRMWRVGEVVKVGPQCKNVEVGMHLMYPSDRGIPMIGHEGESFIFLNEERIFAQVKIKNWEIQTTDEK
jgi:co-chaperonin GroES (HSP10)